MDTEILRSLMNYSLTKEEAQTVLLEEEDLIDGVVECEASAFVKIHALKLGFVSLQNFTLAMGKAWNCKDIRVSRVTGPILHVFFPSIEEKMLVMESGPWCFDNHLIIVKNWTRGGSLDVSFDECKFWFQVRGLKEEFYTKEVASKLSSSFMACEVMELRKDKSGKKFFHVQAKVNVNQPIRWLVNFQVGKMQGAGYLAYERLPYLCFHCSLMGHLIRQCPNLPEGNSPHKHLVYGLWIKAPTEKSRVEFRLIADGFTHEKPSLPWEEKKIYSSGMVVDEGKLTPEFPPGCEPGIKTDLNIQNSNLINSLPFIEEASNEEAITTLGFNVEVHSNDRGDYSDRTSPHFKPPLTSNHLGTQAPLNSNSETEITLQHESSLQTFLPDGKRLLKGSHSKGLEDTRDLYSTAEVARQPSRTP
ncbi:hypothetical protein LIER_12838 [Lithospermum erythrorhizon]|uniref:CCHC-type domain-containing protein n=1 Tax=Lithospermum erythrorhizon TaxID=34254 RepID=A0AAV3PVA8_LITER